MGDDDVGELEGCRLDNTPRSANSNFCQGNLFRDSVSSVCLGSAGCSQAALRSTPASPLCPFIRIAGPSSAGEQHKYPESTALSPPHHRRCLALLETREARLDGCAPHALLLLAGGWALLER